MKTTHMVTLESADQIQTMNGPAPRFERVGPDLAALLNASQTSRQPKHGEHVIEATVDGHKTSVGLTNVVDGNRDRVQFCEDDSNLAQIDRRRQFLTERLAYVTNPDGSPRLIDGRDVYAIERAKLKGELAMLDASRDFHQFRAAQLSQQAQNDAFVNDAVRQIVVNQREDAELLAAINAELKAQGLPDHLLPKTLEEADRLAARVR